MPARICLAVLVHTRARLPPRRAHKAVSSSCPPFSHHYHIHDQRRRHHHHLLLLPPSRTDHTPSSVSSSRNSDCFNERILPVNYFLGFHFSPLLPLPKVGLYIPAPRTSLPPPPASHVGRLARPHSLCGRRGRQGPPGSGRAIQSLDRSALASPLILLPYHSLSPFISIHKVQRVRPRWPPSRKHLLAALVPRAHSDPGVLPTTHPTIPLTASER